MSTRHKVIETFNETVRVGTVKYGLKIIPYQVDPVGKTNHKIRISVKVTQSESKKLDVGLYVLKQDQFLQWLPEFSDFNTFTFSQPPSYIIKLKPEIEQKVEIPVKEGGMAYIILDNRHSSFTVKEAVVSIHEEWDEKNTASIDVVTTIPPRDKSLMTDVVRMIENSKKNLKIITPYIDMSLIAEILSKIEQNVEIKVVTRTKSEFAGRDKKATFDHLKEKLNKNHKTNDYVHSRLLISDDLEALVSSADLTQDSLIGQFNAGIVVSDPTILKKLLDYFEIVFQKSSF